MTASRNTFLVLATICGLVLTTGSLARADVIFVDVDATGANDGTSWDDAFNDLQDGLAAADAGDELWVAEGSYTPAPRDGDREATYQLISGVGLYGGFAGDETNRDQRDWETNETILTGDLNGDDGHDYTQYDENSYHVVTGSGTNLSAVLDGFTISAGNADGPGSNANGAGIHIEAGSPTVGNCLLLANRADSLGGAIYIGSGSAQITECDLLGNVAEAGGGLSISSGSPILVACTFSGNQADLYGGGIRNYGSPSLIKCTFTDNASFKNGGGFYTVSGSPTLTGCVFTGNSVTQWLGSYGDGGAMYSAFGTPVLTDCQFVGNVAEDDGGALRNWDGSFITMTNCTFVQNSAYGGGGISNDYGATIVLTNCLLSGNFVEESVALGGGINNQGSAILTNCSFVANWVSSSGSSGSGGGLYDWGQTTTVTNCLFWGNIDSTGIDESAQITASNSSDLVINYSCVQGWAGELGGIGNTGADPRLMNALGLDGEPGTGDENFRLRAGSSCIDAGSNLAVPPYIDIDLDGNPRLVDDPAADDTGNGTPPIVDIGVYEYQADCNHNGIFDSVDIADETSGDCNTNGIPDECDIADGTLEDPDGDGFPDACAYPILLVDAAATGGDDGTSWDDAYMHLQDALDHAATSGGAVKDIWVAAGTYLPDRGVNQTPSDRSAAFQLLNDLAVYGGFAGTETELDERDPVENVTILSGDLEGDDGPNLENTKENAYHVVTASNTNPTAVLDGFTITGGNADAQNPDDSGGGFYCELGNLTLIGCTFAANSAVGDGGAMYNRLSNGALTGCTFLANVAAGNGGAVANSGSSPRFTEVTFCANTAGDGGAMYNYRSGNPVLSECVLDGNVALSDGGGMFNDDRSNPELDQCTFTANVAAGAGGGMFNDANTVLERCEFIGNTATNGGALYNLTSHPTVMTSIFVENSASSSGGAIYNLGEEYVSFSDPDVVQCAFLGNTAGENGGAIYSLDYVTTTLINCSFLGNMADLAGGGMFASYVSDSALTNCVFSGNVAGGDGGGFFSGSYYSESTLTQCTFSGNTSGGQGGGIHLGSDAILSNCVLWGNGDSEGMEEGAQLHVSGVTADVNYTCIQGLTGDLGGIGNIGDDPLFVDADGVDDIVGTEDDDIRLTLGSPCIDAADNNAVPADEFDLDDDGDTDEPLPYDLDAKPRFLDNPSTEDTGNPGTLGPPVVDMGAYEFYDCNGNGIPDDQDIAQGRSDDCNGNGVPDECEPDCNRNGVADSCDIADGTSQDLNGNGVPDECEPDCNGNGIPDDVDIAAGTSEDCNANAIPDACDIAAGTSEDCNGNGSPDECDVALIEQTITTVADGAAQVFAADLDGDGDTDVLSASRYDDKIAWYENTDGLGSFGPQQIITAAANYATSVFAADLDGDGDTDVLSASSSDDKIAWYENTDGLGSFGPQQIISIEADAAYSVFAADLDGDGDTDVLSASIVDDKIAWYENTDGLGSFGPQQIITTEADYAFSVFAADLDGDGDTDVLSASPLDDKIAWYENRSGLGSVRPPQNVTTNAGSTKAVFDANRDGDGGDDVLSASANDDKIAWYETPSGV
ncbi:MAG: VCBS repeat-containing protein, partial [Planctomycetes bacterium]|nr:VCBS repeat-containing protein [Planctomycetota bacterium]